MYFEGISDISIHAENVTCDTVTFEVTIQTKDNLGVKFETKQPATVDKNDVAKRLMSMIRFKRWAVINGTLYRTSRISHIMVNKKNVGRGDA
jgi:hypothetical protein